MKKIIALVLSAIMICCFSVTAFAAKSPTASEKITVVVRKADVTNPTGKVDIEYTLDNGATITVKSDKIYGTFNSWSIYKSKDVEAVQGVDYEIVKGSLTSSELVINAKTSIILCGNYNNVKTDPSAASNADSSDSAPQTGDMTVAYAVVIMLAAAAFCFGVKKVYSK